jgi:hypothetical protein
MILILTDLYDTVTRPWGGATIDMRAGDIVDITGEGYAFSAKPTGVNTLSIPETASFEEFRSAWFEALDMFAGMADYLGIFHNDNKGTIDFDPTIVVKTRAEVDQYAKIFPILDGAYEFHTGNGYYPNIGR